MGLQEEFEECKRNNTVLIKRQYFNSDFLWDDLIRLMYISEKLEKQKNIDLFDSHKNFEFFQEFPGLVHFLVKINNENIFFLNLVTDLFNQFSSDDYKKETPEMVQIFCNFFNDYVSYKHTDPWHGALFQLLGSVTWEVFNGENFVGKYILHPGDLLLIPQHLHHQIFSGEPRASLNVAISYAL